MPSKLTVIQDAIPSDEFRHGGLVTNQLVLLLTGTPLDSEEDIRINTTFKFYSGKLAIFDDDPTLSHKVFIKVENIATGLDKSITIRDPTVDDDFLMTEQQVQTVKNKIWSTGNQVTADLTFVTAGITGATINGSNNTFLNIGQGSLLQITDKAKLNSNIVYIDAAQTYNAGVAQTFRSSNFKIYNPAGTFIYTIVTGALTAHYNLSIPLIAADDSFALKGINNNFTAIQKITNNNGQLFTFYRPVNTVGNGAGFYFNFNDSLGAEYTYGFEYVSIENNVLATLRGDYNVQLAINNTLALRFRVFTSGSGGIIFGNNQRAQFSETGLTALRNFTLPDLAGQLVTQEFANLFINKQKIQWNGSNDQLKLFRGSAFATSSLAGLYFSALNNASAEISYANILGGSGNNAADIVAGTEKGQIQLQILESGALTTKVQLKSTTLETFGMVPDFTVGSSDFNAMYIYRPIASAGSNLIIFNLQNVSAVEKQFGYLGVRSETVTAGSEVGSVQLGAAVAGTLQLLVKLQSYQAFIYNSSGFAAIIDPTGLGANRIFTLPNVAGELTVNGATQTLTLKTLTSPTINGGNLNGTVTTDGTLVISRAAVAATAEIIQKWNINDSASYIQWDNASTTNAVNSPRLTTYNDLASNNSAVGYYHYSNILASSDSADNANAVTIFDVRRIDSGGAAIVNRRLFQFRNFGTNVLEIYTTKFDFASLKLTNAVINLDEVTLKHTSAAAGDIPYYDGTRFNRKAQGSNNQFLGVVGGVLGYYTFNASAILSLAALTDDVLIASPTDGQFIRYEAATSKWKNVDATSLGEINTTANVGTGGIGIIPATPKSGSVLNFKSIYAASTKLTVADGTTNNRVEIDVVEGNLNIANMTGSLGDARLTGIAWSKVTSPPATYAPSSHGSNHVGGGSDAIPAATNTVAGIVLIANNAESSGTKVLLSNDSRLSDSRAPTGHAASHLSSGGDAIAAATNSVRGTILTANDAESASTKACMSNDSRLSNARTPSNHASSHLSGGSDAIAAATNSVRGTILIANSGESDVTKACMSNDSRLSDARTPSGHNASHKLDGSDPLVLKGVRVATQTTTTTPLAPSVTTDAVIKIDATAGNKTVNLPSISTVAGQVFWIQKVDSSANTVTIDGSGSETINGALTFVLTAQYQIVMILADSSGGWTCGPYSTERRGKTTASGNGSATVFNLPHGLGVTPHDVIPSCRTHMIASYTADATNIIVTLTTAPASASNNVIFDWSAVP